MGVYSVGTVTVTSGSTVVSGQNTAWQGEIDVNDVFMRRSGGASFKVASIDSDLQLQLSSNYPGPTASGVNYDIFQDFTPIAGLAKVYGSDRTDWAIILGDNFDKLDNHGEGWNLLPFTCTYATASGFTVTGDKTGMFPTSVRVKVVHAGGTTHLSVGTATYNGGTGKTTVTTTSGGIQTPISSVYRSVITLGASGNFPDDWAFSALDVSGNIAAGSLDVSGDITGYGLSRKNTIINSGFDIWQRGVSFATVASGTYTADRFIYRKSGAMVHTITRETDVPTASQFGGQLNYSLKLDCTTVDSSIAAGDHCLLDYSIEGHDFRKFAGRYGTLSFWIKSPVTGTMGVCFRNSGRDRSYVSTITINATNTWEKKTVTILFDYSGGTWNFTNGLGLSIGFVLAAGSTYQTTAGAWQTGNYMTTSAQTNFVANTSYDPLITGVMFELGQAVTEFEFRPIQQELAMCQRYYEKSYNYDVTPANGAGGDYISYIGTANDANNLYSQFIPFQVLKRVSPSPILYRGLGSTDGGWAFIQNSALTEVTSTALDRVNERGFAVVMAKSSGFGASHGALIYGSWTANAEL